MLEISKRNYYSFYLVLAILSCLGLAVAGYLSLSHYWIYTDLTYSSFCAISQAINCDTVAQSPWSILWGIPVAHYGLLGYALFFLLLLPLAKPSQSSQPLWALLVLLGSIFTLISIYFSYISSTKINSYCILCLTSFVINFFLFYCCFLVYRRLKRVSFLQDTKEALCCIFKSKSLFSAFAGIGLLFAILQVLLPHYWLLTNPPMSPELNTGITAAGHPWVGAEIPTVTIEEYSDYQCFQCAKTHQELRSIVARYPGAIRLIHHHYPLDHEFNPTVVTDPFHVGSGKMSLLAIHAMTKGKFWEMNDALFELGRKKESFNTAYLEDKTGIPSGDLVAALSYPPYRKLLDQDILSGMKLRVIATPTFVIENKIYTGNIPPEILKSILERAEQSESKK